MVKKKTITVTRKGYTRSDGTKVKGTTYQMEDKGAPGKTPESKQWAEFEKFTGWKKTQKMTTRRSKVLSATDKRKNMHNRYVEAGRMMNQLANVTTDGPTERAARADANYFFRMAQKTPSKSRRSKKPQKAKRSKRKRRVRSRSGR